MDLFKSFRKPIVGLAESGIGLVARSNSYSSTPAEQIEGLPQNQILQNKYVNAYHNYPIVNGAIDLTAEQVVQDFYFDGPDSDELNKCLRIWPQDNDTEGFFVAKIRKS